MNRAERSRQARRILDRNFQSFSSLVKISVPSNGWIRAIREALGMTREELGARMFSGKGGKQGVTAAAVQSLEKLETTKGVTLASLERVASAMDCVLVYALVPKTNLDDMVKSRAYAVARKMAYGTAQTMKLEAQEYDESLVDQELIRELIDSRGLWKG